ncbi:hypothetical protein BYT27DRAFT_7208961 [Phlegmacium glaucopus]|nr:hypothetical protein BYT27DRAFT_7208961 [Phlegmacium glaucopus]
MRGLGHQKYGRKPTADIWCTVRFSTEPYPYRGGLKYKKIQLYVYGQLPLRYDTEQLNTYMMKLGSKSLMSSVPNSTWLKLIAGFSTWLRAGFQMRKVAPKVEDLLNSLDYLATEVQYMIHNALLVLGKWVLVEKLLKELIEHEEKVGYMAVQVQQHVLMDQARDLVEQAVDDCVKTENQTRTGFKVQTIACTGLIVWFKASQVSEVVGLRFYLGSGASPTYKLMHYYKMLIEKMMPQIILNVKGTQTIASCLLQHWLDQQTNSIKKNELNIVRAQTFMYPIGTK